MIELQFLRCCLGKYKSFPLLDAEQWKSIYDFCVKQSLVGIGFYGVESGDQKPPKNLLLQWFALSEQIKQRNKLLNKRCVELCNYFHKQGLECCILKGQGNAIMYPNCLRRTPGDIDVWTRGKSIRETLTLAHKNNPDGKACYHHVDYGLFNGVEVEVHYKPTFMNNLIADRRLQRWMKEHEDGQFVNYVELSGDVGRISMPTWEFNIVFQLSHIYRHVIQKGVGLRQMIDYYYLLKSDVRSKTEDVRETLKYLNLFKFAGAVMWVLKEILGLEVEYLIAPPDERRGRFLYGEIMRGGNFGMYDVRSKTDDVRWLSRETAVGRNILRLRRDIRLLSYFPSECLWEPVFRAYHFFWRLVHR